MATKTIWKFKVSPDAFAIRMPYTPSRIKTEMRHEQ